MRKSVLSIPLLISYCLCIWLFSFESLLYSEVPISYLTNWVDCNQQGAILSHIESNCMAHNFIGKNCSCLVILLKHWYQQEGFKNMYGLFVSDIYGKDTKIQAESNFAIWFGVLSHNDQQRWSSPADLTDLAPSLLARLVYQAWGWWTNQAS